MGFILYIYFSLFLVFSQNGCFLSVDETILLNVLTNLFPAIPHGQLTSNYKIGTDGRRFVISCI